MDNVIGKFKIYDDAGNPERWGVVLSDGIPELTDWDESSGHTYDNELRDVPEVDPNAEELPPEAGRANS